MAVAPRARIVRQLNLTQAQKDQMKAFRGQQKKDAQAIRDRMRPARQKLQETMTAEIPDEAAVRAAAGAFAAVRGDQIALQVRARAQMMKMLTPEQQKQLNDLRGRVNRMGARRMPRGQSLMRRQQMMRGMNPMMGPMKPARPGMIRPWRNWI
jgi:Spy/CpxP family protein refolding chaperone